MAEPAPAPGTYPFGRAAGSFYLGGCEDALPDARPLLAYGANASPAALAGKLGSGAVAAALAGTLRGWAAVHSRHVSPYGQVPATLVPAPGAALAVHILLVADPAALDATEPNYERVALRGLDLVAEQLAIAAGEPLRFAQEDVRLDGHAVECRLTAEDPARDFAPSPGRIERFAVPDLDGLRVDTHCADGTLVPPYYDSLLAKVIGRGPDRAAALAVVRRALEGLEVTGVHTNRDLLARVVTDAAFTGGAVTTRWLEESMA